MSRLAVATAVALLASSLGRVTRAETDGQLWLSAGVSWQLVKRVEVAFDQHLRFADDFSELDRIMPELTFGYRALDWLKLGAGYRFSRQRNNDDEWVYRHRLHVEARPALRWQRFGAEYRLRYQEQLRGIDASEGGRHTLRQRIKLRWAWSSDLTSYAAGEAFLALGGEDGTRITESEWTVGSSLELGDSELDLFYRLEVPTYTDEPILHIIGLGYRYEL
jgi:hypothetical protein